MIASAFAQSNPCRPLAVTMGDPAGIGLQTTLGAWQQRQRLNLKPFVVFAAKAAVDVHAHALGMDDLPIKEIDAPSDAAHVFREHLPIFPCTLDGDVRVGHSDPAHAPATLRAIEQAVEATVAGHCSAVVTNPITKATLTKAGFQHPGHTEFLGALGQALCPDTVQRAPVMMLVADTLRVVPVTIHIPLNTVAAALTGELLQTTLETVQHALKTDFAIARPRLAVAGLNPHAGESGTLGLEDRDLIAPVLAGLRRDGYEIDGPLPADTMFHDTARARYDAAVCMYHDQALIPIKTLAFDRGVNVTLGLPFVRTSPDHGSALTIAGTKDVSANSLIAALKTAEHIVTNRAADAARQASDPARPREGDV